MKVDYMFIIKASALYGVLAVGFSIMGIFLPERAYLDSPLLGGFDLLHVAGHIVWGLMVGLAADHVKDAPSMWGGIVVSLHIKPH